jgi:two-component system OmpR family sensor kinase
VQDLETATACEREESSFALQSVNLKDVLAETKCYATTLAGDHPISVAHPCSCTVRADRERIGLALRNLVENAAKFSAPGSAIELRAVDQGARIRLEIEDHGIGIDGDDLDRIFGHFGRGRGLTGHRTPGAGLGLYLTRRALRLHGSVLDITSTPGEGTTVSFDLERAPDEPAEGIAFFRIDGATRSS